MRSPALALLLASLLLPVAPSRARTEPAGPVSTEAVELRDRGLASLENEKPEEAEPHYRKLAELLPADPIGPANLAIALLRQQRHEDAEAAIGEALERAPGRADLLFVHAEILQWKGDLEAALARYREAMEADPDDLEILWATVQQARTIDGDEAAAAARQALFRLSRLRPENLVVMMQIGQGAIASGNRGVATTAFGRVRELLWQADPVAVKAMELLEEALEADDLAGARVPAIRLENVLKVSPMYRESLRELKTGIQGIPVRDFVAGEPAPAEPSTPPAVRFVGRTVDPRPTAGASLAVADLDGDERPDLARIRVADAGAVLEIRRAAEDLAVSAELPAPAEVQVLLDVDLDNDGATDLVALGPGGGAAWRNLGGGNFEAASGWIPAGAEGVDAVPVDFDIEGDLDLAVAGAATELLRNPGTGSLEAVGGLAFPETARGGPGRAVAASDLDRDGDLDLALAGPDGIRWLDNLRQGRFADRTAEAGLTGVAGADALVAADLDHDGLPDLVLGGSGGVRILPNLGGAFGPDRAVPELGGPVARLAVLDADNDGRLDLAVAGPGGVRVAAARTAGWTPLELSGAPAAATALAPADLDGDGDLDLVVAGPAGLAVLDNEGGSSNGWLQVRLRGLVEGNSKNNLRGEGSVVEVRDGGVLQFREARGDVVHFGLGSRDSADVLRVVWTNGVPQNRLDLGGRQRIVEEQLLKGSCPFLYAWDGEGFRFVTDLLWGAPIGLPLAAGVYAPADPGELVRIDGLVVGDEGLVQLRITEELWEAAFFDAVRLWAVDHPDDVEVASNLRIRPGEPPAPETVLATRELRPLAAASDGRGRDVTERVRHRDEVYADGYTASPYQGVAAEPWSFVLDLGAAPGRSIRLHLDGWIFPADASLHLALEQRGGPAPAAPRLEVETPAGWQVLMPSMGFPAGKTKTMVVDTPPLPGGASRLRIVAGQWLHWDRIAWSVQPVDAAARVVARLAPSRADLRYRGFSARVREAPNAPHGFDYARVSTESPWLPFPGRYTRFGDVRPLLGEVDDRSVVLAAGDEIALEFDVGALPPPAPGTTRTWFLESVGWDKDADRNTGAGTRVEPLPFHAMTTYPYGPDERFPESELHRRYREEWLTREIAPPGLRPAAEVAP